MGLKQDWRTVKKQHLVWSRLLRSNIICCQTFKVGWERGRGREDGHLLRNVTIHVLHVSSGHVSDCWWWPEQWVTSYGVMLDTHWYSSQAPLTISDLSLADQCTHVQTMPGTVHTAHGSHGYLLGARPEQSSQHSNYWESRMCLRCLVKTARTLSQGRKW